MSGNPFLFCAIDAGGARNLAPVAALVGPRASVIGSDVTVPIFAESAIASRTARIGDASAAADLLKAERPQVLVCGTSRFVAAERRLIAAAREQGVPSVVVLDEWYDYRMRFADEAGRLAFLSDLICCPDRMARDEADADGLPASRLRVTGSPSLSALADRISAFASTPPPRPDCWRADATGLRILFVSETHLADYGDAAGRSGPLGGWLGYTERDVRAAVARAIAARGLHCTVVEKLHPNAMDSPAPPQGSSACAWHTVVKAPLWPLLWDADVVIGMKSMALLEAALMGHRPLSFQPNLQGRDRCTASRLGLADRAASDDELAAWLQQPPARGAPRRPAFADARAASNVLDVTVRLAAEAARAPLAASS